VTERRDRSFVDPEIVDLAGSGSMRVEPLVESRTGERSNAS
jgi:hypothetical protein